MNAEAMYSGVGLEEARDLLARAVTPLGTERIPVSRSFGRVLAEDIRAAEHVPAFDRSPYDGYAFRAADSAGASRETPVTLRILEEIAAGDIPTASVTAGTAVKILTGAPIPPGADAVQKFEETRFSPAEVTLFQPSRAGENIVRKGEDVRAGELLARAGDLIDPAVCGVLAAQGAREPLVFRRPKVGILSTGNELREPGDPLAEGQIYNTNRYTLEAACVRAGADTVYLGIARDEAADIAAHITEGLAVCDMVITTGGVSTGDYDLTPEALALAGVPMLIRKLALKPGGACAYGVREGKPVCCLSGNPASSITNFHAVAMAALRRLCGRSTLVPPMLPVSLTADYPKASPQTRLLRGALELSDGTVRIRLTGEQGNAVLSSLIGCDVMAVVPAGTGPLKQGDTLQAFLI